MCRKGIASNHCISNQKAVYHNQTGAPLQKPPLILKTQFSSDSFQPRANVNCLYHGFMQFQYNFHISPTKSPKKKVPLCTASIGAAILVASNKWGEVTIGAHIADKMAEKTVCCTPNSRLK